ncbi:malate synthase A, partial [Streptomyces sp. SID11233]|nr:malate synthase A [Streptomyces sp. SID11233]
RYIEAWLRGSGAVAIFNLMEDAATAEISRSQLWQWIDAGVEVEHEGAPVLVTRDLVRRIADEDLAALRADLGEETYTAGRWDEAYTLLLEVALADTYADFLTVPAYARLRG